MASELKKLNVNKSTSDDQILTKFIVIAPNVIPPYFTYLVASCLLMTFSQTHLKLQK